jgi:hypothetical protein
LGGSSGNSLELHLVSQVAGPAWEAARQTLNVSSETTLEGDRSGAGSRITQRFEPRGFLAPIVGPMMGGRILKTFNAVLTGLKKKVES